MLQQLWISCQLNQYPFQSICLFRRFHAIIIYLLNQLQLQLNLNSTMNFSKAVLKMKRYLRRYDDCNDRIDKELEQFVQLFKNHNITKQLSACLIKKWGAISTLKMLILLHRMIIENLITNQMVSQIISNISIIINDEFDMILEKKILTTYRLYIQKRSLFDTSVTRESQTQKQDKVYQLMNLINLGASFTDCIYIIGRYYADKYKFIIDFNIVLATDLGNLYNVMVDNIKRPSTYQLLYQIQKVHENMFLVFYNCYYHNEVRKLAPKWVLTDFTIATPEKTVENRTVIQTQQLILIKDQLSTGPSKKKSHSLSPDSQQFSSNYERNKLSVEQIQVDISIFKDLSHKNECEEEQRSWIELISSMERVVASFHQ